MKITFFKDMYAKRGHFVDVEQIVDRIRTGVDEDAAHKVRAAADKKERQQAKFKLPAVCWSGQFTERFDDKCIEHSGLICLDFDGFDDSDMLADFIQTIQADTFTFICFISPSGLGAKVVVKIPAEIDNHKGYFRGLQEYYNSEHFDNSSVNLSRLCFSTFDPDIYHNEDSEVFSNFIEEPELKTYRPDYVKTKIPITSQDEIANRLLKWHKDKFPMYEGQRNNNAFKLAAAFSDFGVDKAVAVAVIYNEFGDSSFELSEINTTVDSAYRSCASNFGTKVLEDSQETFYVKQLIRKGEKQNAVERLQDAKVDNIDDVIEHLEREIQSSVFWNETERGAINIDYVLFFQFLENNGFCKFYTETDENKENFIMVKVYNNIVEPTSVNEIKDFVLNYLKDQKNHEVLDKVYKSTKMFSKDVLSGLNSIEITFLEDTEEVAYVYYRNCIVKVTSEDKEVINYMDVDGYIWGGNRMKRDYIPTEVDYQFDYNRFIHNVSKSGQRKESMESVIGYLMHSYKKRSFCPAIIFNDEVISDNPEGGTGKGIFCNAIGKMRRTATIDGKSWEQERFAFQTVGLDTQVLTFDDVKARFNFEGLFSIITEGLTVERKGKDAITIPFEKSPKICITTNYAIKGTGNSFARRKFDLEFHPFYTKNFTPREEFGRMLFDDWDSTDWSKFDAYMIQCLQNYLKTGLVQADFVNLKIRNLGASTSHQFIEWLGLTSDSDQEERIPIGSRIYCNKLYFDFVSDYPDYGERGKLTLTKIKFGRWVENYGKFIGNYHMSRDAKGKYIQIEKDEE